MTIEAGRATFSGFLAAKVFGVVSAKTKIIKVNANDANMTDPSPQSLIASIVAILAAKILTRLLPNKIVPIKWSKFSNKRSVRLAFLLVLASTLRR
jgi:hypothetical protein